MADDGLADLVRWHNNAHACAVCPFRFLSSQRSRKWKLEPRAGNASSQRLVRIPRHSGCVHHCRHLDGSCDYQRAISV